MWLNCLGQLPWGNWRNGQLLVLVDLYLVKCHLMSFYSSVLAYLWVVCCIADKWDYLLVGDLVRKTGKAADKRMRAVVWPPCAQLWPVRSMETVTSIISSILSSWCSGANEKLQHCSWGAKLARLDEWGCTLTQQRLYFLSQSPVHWSASHSVSITLLLWPWGDKFKPNCNAMPRGQNNEQLLCVCC